MPNAIKQNLDKYILKNLVSDSHYTKYKTEEALKETLENTVLMQKAIDTVVLNANKLINDINAHTPQIRRQ